MTGSPFLRQTDLVADLDHPGRYRVDISADWNAPFVPHGGLTAAVAARAMQDHLDRPDQPLRTMTTVFVSRIPPGPVHVDVSVLRAGRRMSHAAATLYTEDGSVGLTALAVFGGSRPGFAFTDAVMPEPRAREDCPSIRDAPEGAKGIVPAPLWDMVEGRMALGHAPWNHPSPTTSEQVYWYRFDDPPWLADGRIDRTAQIVLCDTMVGSIYERMGSGLPVWLAPSVDLTVHLFEDTCAPWLLARNRARLAGDGYVSLELELWDPDRRALIALATQMAFVTFPQSDVDAHLVAPGDPGARSPAPAPPVRPA